MKKIICFVVFCLASCTLWGQSAGSKVCRTGVTYEISQSPNWGYGKPVVTGITPYSPAEKSGLHLSDIIEEIDGIPVSELSPSDIQIMMNPAGKNNISLAVRSVASTTLREVTLTKECKSTTAISEAQLAMAFNMYSLETSSIRRFVCPFKITATSDAVDFAQYHSFAFAPVDENNRRLETNINKVIEQELTDKGLAIDAAQPDMLIQTFYYFDHNPKYVGPSIKVKTPVYRYNKNQRKMVKVPFLGLNDSESEAPYLLQFGFRIIDQKLIPGRVLWECEANELLEEAYRLEDYAQIHVPLMCMQFPYMKSRRNAVYSVTQCSYNYTGIHYNMDNLSAVVSVDRNSPAYEAGIRAKSVIEGIDGQSTDYSIDEFTAAYRQFITNTMKYRDPSTKFTDENGFSRCMYWKTFNYTDVSKAIKNPNNLTTFAYLYYFTPYINPTSDNTITFYVKQGSDRKKIVLRPTIRTSTIIEIK